jgi:hypothetical protein
MRDIRSNPIISQGHAVDRSEESSPTHQPEENIREYLCLVKRADDLFAELKHLKQSNRRLLNRLCHHL